jgi:hypothetical protein
MSGLITMILAGCSSMTSSKDSVQTRGEDDGVVFGSFVINVAPDPEHEGGWAFRKGQKADNATYAVIFARSGLNPLKKRYMIRATPEHEEVFFKVLPAGQYAIEKISKEGFTNLEVQLDQPSFRAVAGQTTYIGKITVHLPNRIMAGSSVHLSVGDTQQDTTNSLGAEHGTSVFAGVVKGLATPGGGSAPGFSETEMQAACMKVTVREVVMDRRQESAAEARQIAHLTCQVFSGTCAEKPSSDVCQREFKRYGLTK